MRSSVPVRRIACSLFSSAATPWALRTRAVPLTANSQEAAVTALTGPRPMSATEARPMSATAARRGTGERSRPTCPPCVGPRSEPRASRLSRYLYHCFTTWFTCGRKIQPGLHFVVPYAYACQAAVQRSTLRASGDVCLAAALHEAQRSAAQRSAAHRSASHRSAQRSASLCAAQRSAAQCRPTMHCAAAVAQCLHSVSGAGERGLPAAGSSGGRSQSRDP